MPRRSTTSTPVKAEPAIALGSPSSTKKPRSMKNGVTPNGTAPVVTDSESLTTISQPNAATKPKPTRSKAKVSETSTVAAQVVIAEEIEDKPTPAKRKAKTKAPLQQDVAPNGDVKDEKPAKKARKVKAWPPAELDPSIHPPRSGHPAYTLPSSAHPHNGGLGPSSTSPLLIGAHCSMGGGAAGALLRAGLAGFNGVALFVKNQKQWKSPPMEQETIDRFRKFMLPVAEGGLGYSGESILVHGSYLINLGNPDPNKWNFSYDCFKDDLERCHQLGIKLYNWHPGSTVGACTREDGCANVARAINRAHKEVPEVITVIENMANAKSNILGSTFEELALIISLVDNKSRVRICLDTCHLFGAGYDIRTPEAYAETMRQFREVVGNQYLAGMHLNDSKAELGSSKDLHENIGLGHIGLTAFRCIVRDPLMAGIPMILETPIHQEGELMILESMETKMLYEIQAITDDEWDAKKIEIEARWRADRDRISPPKVKGPKKPKGKKKGEEACESHDEDD